MKYSKQRELIQKIVESSCDHPSAIDVYERVKQVLPHISLGTVYRNLNWLVDEGKVKRIKCDASDHFDKTLVVHDHFKCMNCEKIFDVKTFCLEDLNGKIMEETGYLIQNRDLIFTGICHSCNNRKKV